MRNPRYDAYFSVLIFWATGGIMDQKVGPLGGTFGSTAISKYSGVTKKLNPLGGPFGSNGCNLYLEMFRGNPPFKEGTITLPSRSETIV